MTDLRIAECRSHRPFRHPRVYIILCAFMVILWTGNVSASECGDVNDDGSINLGDAVYLLSFVFKGGDPPAPIWLGNANGDGAVNVGDAVYLINYVFRYGPAPGCITSQVSVEQSGCGGFRNADLIPTDQDCIEYEYDGRGVLSISRFNAGFNCCIDSITAAVTLTEGDITIDEKEHLDNGGCYCLCLYDLNYVVEGLLPGEYTVTVIEPYVEEGMEPLEFTINLTSEPSSGSFCVTRTHYPWDLVGENVGKLIGISGCKPVEGKSATISQANGQDGLILAYEECLTWNYDGEAVLELRHVNVLFNCCLDTIMAEIVIDNGIVTITESEQLANGGCDCLCLYDLEFVIHNPDPLPYEVRIFTGYPPPEGNPMEFDIGDIGTSPVGESCIARGNPN